MKRPEVLIPWIPDYFTIALYPQSGSFVAHELQSGLWARDSIMLDALKKLASRLIEIQLSLEKATKKNWKVKRTPEIGASKEVVELAKRTGIILRNVVLEP